VFKKLFSAQANPTKSAINLTPQALAWVVLAGV
jgi:hypothetical protein